MGSWAAFYVDGHDEAAIAENVKTFIDALNKAKPSGAKGTYLKRASISSTMGPGVKLDIADLVGATA